MNKLVLTNDNVDSVIINLAGTLGLTMEHNELLEYGLEEYLKDRIGKTILISKVEVYIRPLLEIINSFVIKIESEITKHFPDFNPLSTFTRLPDNMFIVYIIENMIIEATNILKLSANSKFYIDELKVGLFRNIELLLEELLEHNINNEFHIDGILDEFIKINAPEEVREMLTSDYDIAGREILADDNFRLFLQNEITKYLNVNLPIFLSLTNVIDDSTETKLIDFSYSHEDLIKEVRDSMVLNVKERVISLSDLKRLYNSRTFSHCTILLLKEIDE